MDPFYPEEEFKKLFNQTIEDAYFCPGRINLIGEHIDYNGGWVMPCAIDRGTYLFVSSNKDQIFRFRSLNFSETLDISIDESFQKKGSDWFNYPLGVLKYFQKENIRLEGRNFLFYGNLPISSGLSSSASIEVVMAYAMNMILKANLSLLNLVKLTKKVENEFIGVNSGIMDQFAVAFGKESSAIVLNCSTLDYSIVPIQLQNYKLVIIDTNKARTLADSQYNTRVLECNQALELLNKRLPIKQLCDLNSEELYSNKDLIQNPVIWNRARHVVEENDRVKKAVQYFSENRLLDFGSLLYASHNSLKELYEVSGKELDFIVDFSSSYRGVIGARMTGAGFGGCAIALVQEDLVEEYSQEMIAQYQYSIGYPPTIYPSHIRNGVNRLFV